MADSRLTKLAQVITEYSTEIKRGDRVFIAASPIAQPLTLAVIEQVIKRGGLPHIAAGGSSRHLDLVPGALELMLKYGSDEQLQYLNPFVKLAVDQFEVRIVIQGDVNTKSLSSADPRRIALMTASHSELMETMMRRSAAGDLRWVVTLFPTEAQAQDAEMSLREYEDFVYGAGMLDEDDPVARWQEFRVRQDKYIAWLKGKQRLHVKGPNCDLMVGITDRIFLNSCGKRNFPDGETFTGPEETITEGWVKFTYPAVYQQREVLGVQLEFKQGRVVKAKADRGEDFLLSVLDTDAGSRTLGEFAIGTNKFIQKFTRNILFDEKIGGTIHMALGAAYPDTGGVNKSAVHWDLICDTRDGTEITADGVPFYRNGEFLIK
jgi:aminopeptidase